MQQKIQQSKKLLLINNFTQITLKVNCVNVDFQADSSPWHFLSSGSLPYFVSFIVYITICSTLPSAGEPLQSTYANNHGKQVVGRSSWVEAKHFIQVTLLLFSHSLTQPLSCIVPPGKRQMSGYPFHSQHTAADGRVDVCWNILYLRARSSDYASVLAYHSMVCE